MNIIGKNIIRYTAGLPFLILCSIAALGFAFLLMLLESMSFILSGNFSMDDANDFLKSIPKLWKPFKKKG